MRKKPKKQCTLQKAAEAERMLRPAEELLHELQVQQIELEMQNEQLRQSQVELEKSRDRYVNFYDFAPVGYLTLSHEGMIDEINITGAALLGFDRSKMLHRRFASFVAPESRDLWHSRFLSLLRYDNKLRCELLLQRNGGSHFFAQLECLHLRKDGDESAARIVRIVLTDIAEQKQAQIEISTMLRRYETLMQTSMDGIHIMDVQGNIVEANDAFCSMLGYAKEEVLGLNVADWEAQHSAEELREGFKNLIGKNSLFETMHRRKDGTQINVEVSVNGVEMEGLGLIFATSRDITVKKRAEFALQENEARLRAYMSNISDTIILVSASLNIIYVSPSVTHLLGLLPEDMTDQQAGFFIHPDDMGVMANAMSYVIEHPEEPHTIQYRVRHKDGRWIHVETTGVNMAGNPAINGVLAVMRDITERKKVEEQLRIAAVSFETNEAILITDADANIIRVNKAFTAITGYSPEEVLGKNPRILSSGRQDKAFYAAMWQQLLSAGSWTGEMWDKRKGGQIYPKWLSITAVKDAAGKITQYVASFNDITARKQDEEKIHNLAFYDALTKLPNRRLFLDRLHAALIASARHNNFGAVLFIDLDRFKLLNDTLGHDYGDLLLIEVAVRIKACVREMDTAARLGGDEFVVLIEDISNDQNEASYKVGLVAEKIRESLARPYALNGHEHHSSPSIGVSLYRGNEDTVEELLQHADMAMYQAKDSGRNTVRFFDPAMQKNVATRAALVNDLRSAIAHQQLHLHYQLQVDNNNRPVGAEALLRWIHPQRGMVMPEQFLPAAEESTLAIDIGDWVLEAACRQLAMWGGNEKMRDLELTINISTKQFTMPDFVDKVACAVRTHQTNPARLKLELTESMALDDLHGAIEKMHALKVVGVCLSMDDFGTRYSSLLNLKLLPLDQLKLGRSFVRDVAIDGNIALLVQSIIDLSSKCRISVIAEGVENKAQLTLLRERDCVAYQGFLFSKALSIEEFEQLLNRSLCPPE